jgi:hypothetical protein
LAPEAVERLLGEPVVVEEKVDGANVGLSFGSDDGLVLQSRGHVLAGGAHPQFHPLFAWAAAREPALRGFLGRQRILFGEWLFARHTIRYDRLPDYFLAFDLYDRERSAFLDTHARQLTCSQAAVVEVPRLFEGVLGSLDKLVRLLGMSRVADGPAEGLYVRLERGGVLELRGKFVRAGWVPPGEEHWSHRRLEKNRLSGATSMAPHGANL